MSTNIFPGYILSEPPVITFGCDNVPEKASSSDCNQHSTKGKPMASPEMDTQDILQSPFVPIDELWDTYSESADAADTVDADTDERADAGPLEKFRRYQQKSSDAQKNKKKKKKQHYTKEELLNGFSEEGCDREAYSCSSLGQLFSSIDLEEQEKLTEHRLTRILAREYRFGCYGSSLYVRGLDGVYAEVSRRTIEKLLMSTLTEEQLNHVPISMAKGVHTRLLALPEVGKNQLTFPKKKVLFANGCFNIVSQKPAKVKDSDFFVTRINARYIPNEELSCPYFDAYLESSSGGDETIKDRICAMLGYLMLPGNPGKKILVLGTAKNSGKSMISRFFQRLVGPNLVCGQTPFDMSESHALSEFSGKIANMAMDLPATIIKPASIGVMKVLSGGDMISVNPKGRDRQSMICFTKQVLGTNSKLRLQQFDEAFWARVEIIPYTCSISPDDRIDDLEDRLMKERDAIVTKCMNAASKLILNGYIFPACPVADAMKDSWVGWETYAKEFLNTFCIEEAGSFTPSTTLYNAYMRYCQERSLPYGQNTGFIRFAKRMFPSEKNPRPMINGVQQRGLPDVRFLGKVE